MPFDEIAFAVARSNNAAKAANENSRPMAQYALLINGAAASAVIAYLSKDRIDPTVLGIVPRALMLYAVGCVCGALAMFFMTESLDYWNGYWEDIARGSDEADDDMNRGRLLWWVVRIAFWLSIACFVFASTVLAYALVHSSVPMANCVSPPG
jgi:hypothetical protein